MISQIGIPAQRQLMFTIGNDMACGGSVLTQCKHTHTQPAHPVLSFSMRHIFLRFVFAPVPVAF